MPGFLGSIALALNRALSTVADGLARPDEFRRLAIRFGWSVDAIDATNLNQVSQIFQLGPLFEQLATLAEQLAGPDAADDDLALKVIEILGKVMDAVKGLANAAQPTHPYPLDQPAFWETVTTQWIGELTADLLASELPVAYGVLVLVGVIEVVRVQQSAPGKVNYEYHRIHWDLIPRLLNPLATVRDAYGWGGSPGSFQHDRFLRAIQLSLGILEIPARRELPSQSLVDHYYAPGNPSVPNVHDLQVPLLQATNAESPSYFEFGFGLMPIPAESGSSGPPVGLLLHSILTGALPPDEQNGTETLSIDAGGGFENDGAIGVEVRPDGAKLKVGAGTIDARLGLLGKPASPWVLARDGESTRLELTGVSLGVAVHGDASNPEFVLTLEPDRSPGGLRLVIDPEAGDGLTTKLLGSEHRQIDIPFSLHWSSQSGLTLFSNIGLTITVPVNVVIAGLSIERATLEVSASGNGVRTAVSVTVHAALGPVEIAIDEIGASVSLAPTGTGQRGSFGDLDLNFGFKPPSGVGISIESGPVSGGGFIALKDGRYTGALELKIYSVSVKAFGVIDTKLPDGSKGFSFVIVISAEFTPIQLGFGFTLLGVGGMIGINRSFDQEGLRKALLDGGLENILFPKNVVERAPEIIGSLQAILPPVEGKYVFGPLAKLGWGSPTLIEAEIGIILELPGPIVTILGELHCNLPDPDDALVALNMGVTGRLDFPKKALSIDATLRESRVGTFPVHGQMAMRVRWRDRPLFALAVGGFHPAFQAPPDFPKLELMSADFGRQGNPDIQLSGFFAVTSNTVQLGGALTVHASDSGVTLDAELSAKALFVFSPFHFEADISAGVRVAFHGYGIGVHLHAMLSGPSPWHLQGEACVSVLWWDACLNVNHTFGEGTPVTVPTVDPWNGKIANSTKTVPGLSDALGDAHNWTPLPPPRAFQVVTLAELPPPGDPIPLFDPMGKPQVRQRILPLENANSKITHLGSSPSSGPDRFTLTKAQIGQAALHFDADVKDFFAPAQYFDLTDAQKLSGPSFDTYKAGYTFDPAVSPVPVGSVGQADITYDTFVRDSRAPVDSTPTLPSYALSKTHLLSFSLRSATERFGLGQSGTERFLGRGLKTLFGYTDTLFVITNKATLGVTSVLTEPASQWEAILGLEAHVALNPDVVGQFQVTPKHVTDASP